MRLKLEYEESKGHYNEFPKGWKEITEEEFVRSHFFTYNPESIENRQMHRYEGNKKKAKESIHATLYHFFDGAGVALSGDYWKGKLRYFRFGCEHKYRELTEKECQERGLVHCGMCYHVCECEKCNHILSYDSSG